MAALTAQQRIRTSGARAVEYFTVSGLQLLAIPQLAVDVPGAEPNMNGGDSATEMLLLRRRAGRFEPWSTIAAPGGEDAEFFRIGERAFLAIASIRTGSGPYQYETQSQIFEWDGSSFVPFQKIPTFAAKQWKCWEIDGRTFLGLAQGVQLPGLEDLNRDSIVYEWDGSSFVEHQRIPSRWAYNWHHFTVDDSHFVAHAEHIGPSVLYRWDGSQLQPHQQLMPMAGRAFVTFVDGDELYLLAASIAAPVRLMRWQSGCFVDVQTLEGLGARELAVLCHDGRLFVVRANFILGPPSDPQPEIDSQIYEWASGTLRLVGEFPTCGATDIAVLDDGAQIVVSQGLNSQVRFGGETVLYSFTPEGE